MHAERARSHGAAHEAQFEKRAEQLRNSVTNRDLHRELHEPVEVNSRSPGGLAMSTLRSQGSEQRLLGARAVG